MVLPIKGSLNHKFLVLIEANHLFERLPKRESVVRKLTKRACKLVSNSVFLFCSVEMYYISNYCNDFKVSIYKVTRGIWCKSVYRMPKCLLY